MSAPLVPRPGIAFTLMDGDRVLGCAGLVPIGGHAEAWALLRCAAHPADGAAPFGETRLADAGRPLAQAAIGDCPVRFKNITEMAGTAWFFANRC